MGFINSILLFIIFYQSVFHLLPVFVAANDVLMPGDVLDSLNSDATLISANGNFTLGFSTFISSTTNFTYLGIWYASFGNGVGNGSIVWVANRDNPMTGSGMLMMDDLGSLKVVNGSGATLFNVFNNSQVGSGNNTNTRGVLQDSGNFLVYDATDNRTLWQSFDHPTDTLLPGMKIGYNHTTGQNWTLISWLSDVTPATGAFTMRLEQYQNSPQLVIYRRGEVYRASMLINFASVGTTKLTWRIKRRCLISSSCQSTAFPSPSVC